ncbi:hypothetical protein [Mycetocola sp.]|uniref:hypothetical protein n=1 Tax=Mycetocola sp. TaxID=1871042 RepID=UPI003988DBC8
MPPSSAAGPYAFAVIGDVPYGTAQLSAFPRYISDINADPNVRLVSHLGDLSSPLDCSTSYFSSVRGHFDQVVDPLIYTPGDNEWADCWRAPTGGGYPLTKLAALRSTFFPAPGTSLGMTKIAVSAQSSYPENVTFNQGGLTFAAVHAVGSRNDLVPWYGASSPSTTQKAEVTARIDAAISLIRDTFVRAKGAASRAVVLITQADMFIPNEGTTYKSGFQKIVQTIASESRSWGKPVFLINGDTHAYRSDKPLTSSTWLSYYAVGSSVPNLSRITIKGGTSEWTRFTVVTTSAVLQWQRVPSP